MGDRAQVFIKDTGVYLYTHWGGYGLVENVRSSIGKKWRWKDPEYLARIIFCGMVPKSKTAEETGYGIGTVRHGDIWLLITISCEDESITIENFIEDTEELYSFKDFIK